MDNGYLVQWYGSDSNDVPNKTEVVAESEVWRIIDDAKNDGHRIVVYKVGRKLLDWSESSND